tara:strand:+ start:660 stop:962 length:303 start_codon:yes stop_codon:yes gene_type:complete
MLEKVKKNYILLIGSFLIIYFIFNAIGGDRGLFSYYKKKNEIKIIEKNSNNLQDKIKDLEFKNSLITEKFDLDYIETLIRDKFVYGKSGEDIYIFKNDNN